MEVKRSQIKIHQWITSPLCPSVDRVNFVDLLLGTCSALEIKLLFKIYLHQHQLPLQTQVVNKTNHDKQHSKKRKLDQQLPGPSSTAGGDMKFETEVAMDADSDENNETVFDPVASQEQDSTAQSPPSSTTPISRLGLERNLKVKLNSDDTCPEIQANQSDNHDGIDGARNHASSKQENADQDNLEEENRNNSHQQSEQTLPAARKVRRMPGRCRFCGKFTKVRPSLATPRKGKQNKDIIPQSPSSPVCNICIHRGKNLM